MVLDTYYINVQTPIIYEDNQSTIKLSNNPSAAKRTKHIDIRHHFIREFSALGLIDARYIVTGAQTADALTKEIKLTERLLELFINYQIPSDLLAYDGDDSAPAVQKLDAVRAQLDADSEPD